MKKMWLILTLSFLVSCHTNHIETREILSKTDIEYIQGLNLIDSDEKIYKFYSEYKNRVAGNFFTNKRIAKYWIDERNKEKNAISFAYYPDIKAIDTIYKPSASYCPYILITKFDNTQFKVCADGRYEDIKSFFEDAINEWKQHKNNK